MLPWEHSFCGLSCISTAPPLLGCLGEGAPSSRCLKRAQCFGSPSLLQAGSWLLWLGSPGCGGPLSRLEPTSSPSPAPSTRVQASPNCLVPKTPFSNPVAPSRSGLLPLAWGPPLGNEAPLEGDRAGIHVSVPGS